jgi:hypothetical protein
MIARDLLIASVVAVSTLVAACGGAIDSPGSSEPPAQNPPSAAPTGTTPGASSSASSPKPAFIITCKGDIQRQTFALDRSLSPQCKPGDMGCIERCKPYDVSFWYAPPAYRCLASTVYSWDGSQCVPHQTGDVGGSLHCKGVDCERIFKTREECDAFALACLAK